MTLTYWLVAAAFLNLASLIAFIFDKLKARSGKWRVSEKALLLFTFWGPIGAILGVWWVRHKSRKLAFLLPFFLVLLLSLVAQGAVLYFLAVKDVR